MRLIAQRVFCYSSANIAQIIKISTPIVALLSSANGHLPEPSPCRVRSTYTGSFSVASRDQLHDAHLSTRGRDDGRSRAEGRLGDTKPWLMPQMTETRRGILARDMGGKNAKEGSEKRK